jgi:uncharacterized protein (TIGR02301 family)
MIRVPDQIALRRRRGIRCLLAVIVGASVLFFFGASDIRGLTLAAPAAAKSRSSSSKDREKAPDVAPAESATARPAPYDHDLQRLSEILGALHFLRGICNRNEGQKWRNEALALINAEAPSGKRHDQMVASFNHGYSDFQQSYRTCTSAADIVIRRYLQEGASIARDLTARYATY